MNQLFLVKLYYKNKLLFVFSVLFIILQGFFTYKGVETFPFFHYGMYSAKPDTSFSISEITIVVNDKLLNIYDYSTINPSFLHNNIAFYSTLKKNNFNDPINKTIDNRFSSQSYIQKLAKDNLVNNKPQLFIKWLKKYLTTKTNISINSIVVKRGTDIIIDAK